MVNKLTKKQLPNIYRSSSLETSQRDVSNQQCKQKRDKAAGQIAKSICWWLLFFFSLPLTIEAATIYKWQNADNLVNYTDSPPPTQFKTQKMLINEGTTASAITSDNISQTNTTTTTITPRNISNNDKNTYQAIQILSPQNQETLFYDDGRVTIKIHTTPQLKKTDRIILYLDNQKIRELINTTITTLQYVDRGTHQLHAQIKNQAGKTLLASPTTTFYMRQYSHS